MLSEQSVTGKALLENQLPLETFLLIKMACVVFIIAAYAWTIEKVSAENLPNSLRFDFVMRRTVEVSNLLLVATTLMNALHIYHAS